ncbi:MAG: hypothetical protein ACE5FK_03820 [Candidatus Methylomirabilia bacterium]
MTTAVAPHLAEGGNLQVQWSGRFEEEPIYFQLRGDSLVNPRSEILTLPEWTNRAVGNLNATIASHPLKLVTKLRPTIETESTGTDLSLPVDDLYLDASLFQRAFLTLGVKNYSEGFGLAFNPTDFLAEDTEQDFSKREEDRKADREGNIVAGLDIFFRNVTLSATVAPHLPGIQNDETRAVLKASMLFEAAHLDTSVLYFYADRPGLGLNLSKSLGEQLGLHAEVAGRWGSTRQQVRKTLEAIGNMHLARFEIHDPPDRHNIFTELVVGGNYTFGDGTNIVGEYYFVQDGYAKREWERVLELIEFSGSRFLAGVFEDLMRSNLLKATELLSFRRLRRHYVFLRFHNATVLQKFDVSISALLNAEDRSVAIVPIIDFVGLKNVSVGISGTLLEGERDSEFGLSPFRTRLSFLFRYFF